MILPLGADNVFAGSDWPISDGSIRGRLPTRFSTQAVRMMSKMRSRQAIACGR
jgi:hypothetical protein